MQTNEIASLLVDCTAQTLCWIPTPGSVEFGSTLAAALETEDGQNLPVGESEPEDLSAESAEVGNCLALTWMTAPQVIAPPDPSVSMPNPASLPPVPDTETVQKTTTQNAIFETPTLDSNAVPESALPVAPETPLPTPVVSVPDPQVPDAAPERAISFESSVTEVAPLIPEAGEARVEPSTFEKPSNLRMPNEGRLTVKEERRAPVPAEKAAATREHEVTPAPEASNQPAPVQSVPVIMPVQTLAQTSELETTTDVVAMQSVYEMEVRDLDASSSAAKSIAPEVQQNTQVPEALNEMQTVRGQHPAAVPLQQPHQPEVVPGQAPGLEAADEPSPHRVPPDHGGGSPRKEKSTKSARLENGNLVPERNEKQAAVVSVQSEVENKNTTSSHQDKPQKQDPEPVVFENAIHRALASPGAPVGEEAKPVQVTSQPAIEPAVIHRAATNLSGYTSAPTASEILTEPQKASVISQIVDKAHLLVKDNNAEIVIALKPDSLGRITLRASMVDNELVTTIVTESHAAKSVLEADLPALHAVLQEAGVDSAHVIVTRETDMNFGGAPSNNSFGFQHPHHSNHQQGAPSHSRWYEEFPWITTESSNPDVATVPVSLDSRYSARSIHYIA